MKRNILLVCTTLAFISNSYSASLFTPHTGIQYISQKEVDAENPKELRDRGLKEAREVAQKGYFYDDTKDSLLKVIGHQKGLTETSFIKYSSLNLAFKYKGNGIIPEQDTIGYNAYGIEIKDKGWTAVAHTFINRNLGVCELGVSNMEVAKGGIQFIKESLTHAVHNKPTQTIAWGSLKTGYTYLVTWADQKYSYELECATPTFDKNHIKNMISYATQLDLKVVDN